MRFCEARAEGALPARAARRDGTPCVQQPAKPWVPPPPPRNPVSVEVCFSPMKPQMRCRTPHPLHLTAALLDTETEKPAELWPES